MARAFRTGLRERIASNTVTGEDASVLAQCLFPLVTGEDMDRAQTAAVAEEWLKAVADIAAGASAPPLREGWHVFAEDGPRGTSCVPTWHRFPADAWHTFETGAAGPRGRTDWDGEKKEKVEYFRNSGPGPVCGVSPLEVTNAEWTHGVVSQISPFPGSSSKF